jgi:homoserine O-succinyltransferase/O-acetyltransferase
MIMDSENKIVRIAILDLYNGHANQGMRCIREIINLFADNNHIDIQFEEFDVRGKLEIPNLNFDAYISSGGPGSPLDTVNEEWEKNYFNWLQQVEDYNSNVLNEQKKHVLFICHSFQLVCRHYNIAKVCKRKSTSFGVFPVHMLEDGFNEVVFDGLKDPFYAVDSRDYQVIEANDTLLNQMGAKILCIEKERPHVPFERAIMGIRFNDYFIGTQFHPEADPIGMRMYLQTEEKKQAVIAEHGEEKWQSMVDHLQDPDKIVWTYNHILPNFLQQSIGIYVGA